MLASRGDVAESLNSLFEPLVPCFSPGRAGVHLGGSGATFGRESTGLEGLLRPLWGIVPLLMGGDTLGHLPLLQPGIAHGTDPTHPEYWGGNPR